MDNRIKFVDEFNRVTDIVTMLGKDEKTPTGWSVWVGDCSNAIVPEKYFLKDNLLEADFFTTESDAQKAKKLVCDVLAAVDEYLHNGETDQLPNSFSTFKNPFGGYDLEVWAEDNIQSLIYRFESRADAETAAGLLKFVAKIPNPLTAQYYLAGGARVIVKPDPADDSETAFLFTGEYSAGKAVAALEKFLAMRRTAAIEKKAKEAQS